MTRSRDSRGGEQYLAASQALLRHCHWRCLDDLCQLKDLLVSLCEARTEDLLKRPRLAGFLQLMYLAQTKRPTAGLNLPKSVIAP